MMLGVLMITAMAALAAVPVIVVLRAPLWQEFHRGGPAQQRATVTVTVVRTVQSPRELSPGRPTLPPGPRLLRGEVTSRKDQTG